MFFLFFRNIFSSLKNLRKVNLSSNRLKNVDINNFIALITSSASIEHLYEDTVQIVEKSMFQISLPNLEDLRTGILNLQYNEEDLIKSFQIKSQTLKGNFTKPWYFQTPNDFKYKIECFCQIYNTYSLIKPRKVFEEFYFIDVVESIRCSIPTKKFLRDYVDEDFQSILMPSECPGKCVENSLRTDCSNNGLKELPRMNTSNWRKKELDLRNNNISYLSKDFVDIIGKLEIPLYLSGNSFKCDCKNLTFLELIRNLSFVQDEVSCWISDKTKISTAISDDEIEDICTPSTIMYISLGLVFFLILVLTLLFVVSFKTEIRIWMYSRDMCMCWISEDEIDKDRMYDAFICYSEKDEHFVQILVDKLETGRNPYKLCLHFRDWHPGEFISKQVVTSVDKSKRSVFILTNNFLDSVCSRLEFRAAHSASMKEKRSRVVIILCQEIDELGELDDEIKSYLNTTTYLKWTDNLFWEKLKYALPHKSSRGMENETRV